MAIALKYVRLFVDDNGISHLEDCVLPLETRDFAPPVTPLDVSDFMAAEGFAVLCFAPDWSGPWHPTPYRQWVFMLSGSLTVTVGDGTERSLSPGDIVLLEDVGGTGHLTRVTGSRQAVAVGVRVADDDVPAP
jgi:mannose-6-phosphate isomerase-like protein (cupin superfamily)